MTLRARRIIYIAFILLFFAITPAIILYTAGYRYNFQKHKLQKTGILILKSKPPAAKIFLNDKLKKETTPARIANLLPGDYSIKIEKDNFYPWQKTLPVESRLTTFAENILLFKKNLPSQIIDGDIEFFSLAPNKEKLIYLRKQDAGREIWLLDFKTNKKSLLYRMSAGNIQDLNPEWSWNSQKILIAIRDGADGSQKYIILDSRAEEAFIYTKLSDFYFEFRGIKNKLIDAALLPSTLLIDSPSDYITSLNKTTHALTVLESNSGNPVFQEKADAAFWSPDGKKILYLSSFELWVYNPTSDQKILITRYGKEIQKSLWINDNYILLLLDNALKTIELDERDKRNVIDLAVLETIDNFDINVDEQKIYFSGAIGNKKGVFELPY